MCWWANQQSHLNKTTALLFIFSLPNEFRTQHDIIVSIRSTFTLCSICIDKWRALLTYFSRSRSVRPFSWYCQFRLRFISVCLALSLAHIFSYIWMCFPSFHSITWFDYTRAIELASERMNLLFFLLLILTEYNWAALLQSRAFFVLNFDIIMIYTA